jgi:DNA-binding NarL/FixJ family response regulator
MGETKGVDRIRVMLVDDHALFRRGVASLLSACPDIEVVGEADNGAEAVARVAELMPDLILMDIRMPEVDGLEATRRIKAEHPYVKIVMLTIAEEDRSLFDAIKAGAQGYLLKKMEPEEFLSMLRGISRGEAPISGIMASKILGEFARHMKGHRTEDPTARLTPREHEVLQLLTQGGTNKEIASTLCVSENTVKNHLKNILEKLHLQNRVQAVAYALREGIVPEEIRRP